MSGNLKVIAKYGTPEEAHLLRNLLEAEGIPVFLEGETMGAWAWHFANALGGVKILVPEENAAAAKEILAAREPDHTVSIAARPEDQLPWDQPPDSWTCPKCQVEVDVNMDVCWACGTTIEAEERPKFPDEAAPQAEPEEVSPPPPDVAFLTVLFPPTFAYFLFTKLCHLLAPLVPDARHRASTGTPAAEGISGMEAGHAPLRAWEHEEPSPEGPGATNEKELDALVLRAWRAAWMGFFLFPPLLLTVYSTWLMVKYWFRRRRGDRHRDRRALWTLAVNMAAALCLGFLLSLAIASLNDGAGNQPGMGPAKEERAPNLEH